MQINNVNKANTKLTVIRRQLMVSQLIVQLHVTKARSDVIGPNDSDYKQNQNAALVSAKL